MLILIKDILSLLLIPLSFMPAAIKTYLLFVVGFFALFICGKMLRWLWDLLPIA